MSTYNQTATPIVDRPYQPVYQAGRFTKLFSKPCIAKSAISMCALAYLVLPLAATSILAQYSPDWLLPPCLCPVDKSGDTGTLINAVTEYQCAYSSGACTWETLVSPVFV